MSAFRQEQSMLRQQAQASGSQVYPLDTAVPLPVVDLFLHRLHQGVPVQALPSADNVGVISEASCQTVPKPSFPPTPPQHLQESEVELEPRFPPSPPQSLLESQVELETRFPPTPPQQSARFQPESRDWEHEDFSTFGESDWDGGGAGPQTHRQGPEHSEVPSPPFSHVSEVGCEAEWYERVRELLNPQDSVASGWGTDRVPQHEREDTLSGLSLPQAGAEPNQPNVEGRAIERTVASEMSRSALPIPTLPWERGIFRSIFGSEDPSNPFDNLIIRMPGPLLPAHSPAAAVNEPRPPVPTLDIASQAFGAFQDVHPSHERDQLMDKAVCKLQLVISRFDKSRLSSELRNALESASPQVQLQETNYCCVCRASQPPHSAEACKCCLGFLEVGLIKRIPWSPCLRLLCGISSVG